jgi:hypothetical protein
VPIAKRVQKQNVVFKTFLTADDADFFVVSWRTLRSWREIFFLAELAESAEKKHKAAGSCGVVVYQANHPVALRAPPLQRRGIFVPSFGTIIYRKNPKVISENPRNQRNQRIKRVLKISGNLRIKIICVICKICVICD